MNAPTSFATLSDGQRACLRLVLGHLNSKEIGRELDISPHTVDQRLRGAMRILNAGSRFEAARKFAEYEGEETYQPLIYQSPDIENSSESAILRTSAKRDKEADSDLDLTTSDLNGGAAALTFDNPSTKRSRLPFPRYRGEKNELSTAMRLGWVVVIAIGSAFSFGGILSGLEALSRLAG